MTGTMTDAARLSTRPRWSRRIRLPAFLVVGSPALAHPLPLIGEAVDR
jgi:hypothetical protein